MRVVFEVGEKVTEHIVKYTAHIVYIFILSGRSDMSESGSLKLNKSLDWTTIIIRRE